MQRIPASRSALPPRLRALAFALALTSTLSGCGDPDIRRGDDALGQGRYDEAIGAYEAARKRLPAQLTPNERLASAHRALAMNLMQMGRCDDARPHMALAEGLTRPVLVDYQQLYECDAARNVAKAGQVDDLKRLLAMGDTRILVLRKLMQYELDLGRDADAVSRLEAVEKRATLTTDERLRLCGVLLGLGRDVQAYPYLKTAVAMDPHDPIKRLKLAEIAETQGEAPLARDIYEALVVEYAKNPLSWLRLAEFRLRNGDPSGAHQAQVQAEALRNVALPPLQEMRPLRRSKR